MQPGDRDWLEDRIRGCLAFAALGDAAGEPFEDRTRAEVAAAGDPLRHLRDGGVVTDDTGQLEALARALVESGGRLTEKAWRAALLRWFRDSPTAARAGPTSRAALEGGAPGPPDGRVGVTNGAAMRAAPCGLVKAGDPGGAADLAALTARVTHDAPVAAGAAAAIAAGVAAGLRPDARWEDVCGACARGAAAHAGGSGLPERIGAARDAARGGGDALERIEAAVGTSLLAIESVPAAVGAFAAASGDPLATVRAAVRLGGDTDTIAAMAGALAGALHGYAAQGPDRRALLDRVTPPALSELAAPLTALARAAPP
ncbi:MAG TPA: ADP-ribosylglycohydrolase family protein [Thermoleophilaceae bacterium]